MTNEKKTPFTLDDVEYFVEDLSQEDQQKLNLVMAGDQKLNRLQVEANLIMLGKDKLVAELKESLNGSGNTTTST